MSHDPQSPSDAADFDPIDEADECWDCAGEGGYPRCGEDSCPAIGGEDGCLDEACWRNCPTCLGEGYI